MGIVAVDVGGTWSRVAGEGRSAVRFATDAGYDRELALLVDAVRAAEASPSAVGVSFGGRVTGDGDVRTALNLRSYEGRRLGRDLQDALGCPVRVAHDATCGLLGEAWHPGGSLHGVERSGYLTVSTGVGAALRLGDTVLTTEAGHQIVPGNERRCACGQTGCLETLVGGRAVREHLGRPLEEVDDPQFWQQYAQSLALGIVNFALSAGLAAVAVGGAVALRRRELWGPLRSAVARIGTYQPLEVVPASHGAPLAGAAVLAGAPPAGLLH
ncbi:glucokinase [Dactylosporangium fulvum]|uniref:ROK family protein n=1 Tax=Dactylosporangium fulvum TaxID=53359 RepID=A0ABY5VUL7_9ACTN|nr:ROK family protein [Dactylosporangium fulvum]UWP79481.1 ROK family protein [Dactylosporangium fulvum]